MSQRDVHVGQLYQAMGLCIGSTQHGSQWAGGNRIGCSVL